MKINLILLMFLLNSVFCLSVASAEDTSEEATDSSASQPAVLTEPGGAIQIDPEVTTIEGVLEQNIPEGAPKSQLPVRARKSPTKVDFSGLKATNSFKDTVVIQKNFMPKTQRFQFSGGATLSMNDVFYRTYGANLRVGYHFTETWGLELNGFYLTSLDSQEKTDLRDKQQLRVENLSTPKSFYGANLYYSSIYGKVAVEDRRIIPFEFYQTLGAGQMATSPASTSNAVYFGLGNLFSISQNSTLRMDLSWYFYNTKTISGESMSSNTIFLTFGYGRCLPNVGAR